MKSSKKSSPQRGFSLIYVAIGIIVLGLIVFLANQTTFFQGKNESQEPSQIVMEDSTLEKIDTDAYTFYYPKDYTKLDKKRSENTILYYASQNKDDTDEGITMSIAPISSRLDTPTSEYCKEFVQFALRSLKNTRIAEVKPVDYIQTHGCVYSYVEDDMKLVTKEKDLWFKEKNDYNVYSATARYLLHAPQDEKDYLNLAVENFMIK